MRVLAGIAAAGASTRAGFDKLTTPIAGNPQDTLLSRALDATAGLDQMVALPPRGTPYFAARVNAVGDVPHVEIEGDRFSATLRRLAHEARARGYDGLLLHLADMPDVSAAHVASLTRVFADFRGTHILRAATASGHMGHPILFPADTLPEFEGLTGDNGARSIVARHRTKPLVIDGEAAMRDVDTRDAFAALLPRG